MKARSLVTVFFALAVLTPTSKPEPRAFRDDQGRQIEAELISFENGQVTIRKDGRDFALPLSKFSVEDREYIQNWAGEKETEPVMVAENAPNPGETIQFDSSGGPRDDRRRTRLPARRKRAGHPMDL